MRRVYPASANFLLVRFGAPSVARERLASAGIVVRDMGAHPTLCNALRITIGTDRDVDAVAAALA